MPPFVATAPAADQPQWWQHPAVIVLSMFCCWPVGIALVWTSRWTNRTKIVVTSILTALVLVWFLSAALSPPPPRVDNTGGSRSENTDRPASPGRRDPIDDLISIVPEAKDAIGIIWVDVTVRNHGERNASYWIELVAESSDGSIKYGDGFGWIRDIAPGQQMTDQVMIHAPNAPDFATVGVTEFRKNG